jgi:hypothetical protein
VGSKRNDRFEPILSISLEMNLGLAWPEPDIRTTRAKRTEGAARSPGRPAAWRFDRVRNLLRLE